MKVFSASKPQKKPPLKDSEFNDPFLEEEADIEAEKEELENEELKARGNTPLEENKMPDPPPEKIQANKDKSEDPIEQMDKNAESGVTQKDNSVDSDSTSASASTSESSPKEVSPTRKKTAKQLIENNDRDNPNDVIVDSEATAMVSGGDEAEEGSPQVHTTAALPKWNPQDPHKGFVSADDDGVYHYKEDSASIEKEYKEDYRFVPKNSNYKHGLLYVTSDGSYVYSGEDSEKEGSASLRVAQMPPLPLENETTGITFEDMYGDQPLTVVMFDYDWLNFRRFGQWILSIGTGFAQTSGPGHFVDDFSEANEKYTLYVLLNHISFIYRFQYSDHPWFVPYVSFGGIPALLAERRDDNKRNKSKFVPAAQGSGGIRFNIGKLDTYGAANLDAEYGINNMWLDLEFRRIQSFDKKIDISNNLINMGLGFDF